MNALAKLKARFEMKVIPVTEAGCHLWDGAEKHGHGYGLIWVNGKHERAHRVAYELYVGPIPDGAVVCHRCDTPACVNPDHLFLGTQAANMADKSRKGRNGRKLTHAQVRAIRKDPRRQAEIASDYGVGQTMVSNIKLGVQWKHI